MRRRLVRRRPYLQKVSTVRALATPFLVGLFTIGALACAFNREPNAPQLDVFECQLDAFADAVPSEAAEDLVMAARAGNFDYVVGQLLRLGLDRARIQALADAFDACLVPHALEPAPDPDAEGVPAPGVLQT